MLSNNSNGHSETVGELLKLLFNDFEDPNPILVIMAQHYDGEALYRLGMLYYKKQTKVDFLKAYKWFELSCHQNYGRAFCMIGQMYQYGKGVLVNHERAMNLYVTAMKLEDDDAKYRIGCLYHYGIGCAVSYPEAFKWYSKSAHQNNPNGQNNLGYLYEKGQGVPENIRVALYWYEKADLYGHETANLKVNKLRSEGVVPQQPSKEKTLDYNQTEVMKSIKALIISDTSPDQVFTRKLESIVLQRKYRIL